MQHRRAQLALLLLLPFLLGSGLISGGGGGGVTPGTGDITDVFSCATGDCNLVHVQDGELLDTSGTGIIDATTAKALFTNPADCAANAYATTIAANGDLTCASVTFAQLTGTVTDCGAGQFVKGIDAGTVLDCAIPAGGAASNSFQTINTDLGTDPVADSSTDTLTLTTANSYLEVTGDAAADRVTLAVVNVASGNVAGEALAVCAGCVDQTELSTSVAGAGLSGGGGTALATASDEQNFLKSGALTCGVSTNGKILVNTTPLQYCDNAATPALKYAAYGTSAGAATDLVCGTPPCVAVGELASSGFAFTATSVNGVTLTTGGSATAFLNGTGAYTTPAAGAPTNATYITQVHDTTLSAEQAMSDLGTGLVLNTTATGVQSIYAGNTCTNQFPRSDNASGAWTCASVGTADITNGTIDANDLNATVAGAGLSGGGGTALATASDEVDFLKTGALTCGAGTKGKMQVHSTTPLQYCDNNAVAPILQYAAYANNIGVANLATNLAVDPTDCSANQFANAIAPSGNLTCAQPNFTNLAGTATDAQLANNYSGVGACAASKWVSTLNDNAAGTCTQPAFTDISGTLAHSSLSGLTTGDPHTQYALLAGRTAGTNNLTLSTDASGLLYGSALTGQFLILRANSADTTTGIVSLVGGSVQSNAPLTFDTDSTSGALNFITLTDGTETVSNIWTGVAFAGGTYTVSNNTSGVTGYTLPASMIFDYTATTNPVFGALTTTFTNLAEIRPTGGAAVSGTWAQPFKAGLVFNPTNAGTVMTMTDGYDFDSAPTFKTTSGGTFGTATRVGFHAKPTVSSGTIATFRGFLYEDKTGAGTLSNQVAVDVRALSGGAVNIGIRNASTTINTPCALTVTAGLSIPPTCTVIEMSSASAVTCDTTTCMAAGFTGQMLTLINIGANNITIDGNGGNTRLNAAADYVMGQWDTLTVIWSGGLVAWVELSRSNN